MKGCEPISRDLQSPRVDIKFLDLVNIVVYISDTPVFFLSWRDNYAAWYLSALFGKT